MRAPLSEQEWKLKVQWTRIRGKCYIPVLNQTGSFTFNGVEYFCKPFGRSSKNSKAYAVYEGTNKPVPSKELGIAKRNRIKHWAKWRRLMTPYGYGIEIARLYSAHS